MEEQDATNEDEGEEEEDQDQPHPEKKQKITSSSSDLVESSAPSSSSVTGAYPTYDTYHSVFN